MSTLAQDIQTLKTHIEDAYTQIENMGGEIPAKLNASNLSASISTIKSGRQIPVIDNNKKYVIFNDYYGEVARYEFEDFINTVAELPTINDTTDLTQTGWNWTIANIKEYLQTVDIESDFLVGATYKTKDNKVHVHIDLTDSSELKMNLHLGPKTNGSNVTINIDWGDESNEEKLLNSYTDITHTYTNSKSYCIKISTVSGDLAIGGNPVNVNRYSIAGDVIDNSKFLKYSSKIVEVNLDNTTTLKGAAFRACFNLKKITLSNTGKNFIENYTFYKCYNLKYIVIPRVCANIGSYAFNVCSALEYVYIPDTLSSIGSIAFHTCCALTNIVFPKNVTNFSDNEFQNCYALKHISYSKTLTSNSKTVFAACYSLRSININDNIKITETMFKGCSSLEKVVFPVTTTSIDTNAFNSCPSLLVYDFSKATQVVSLASTASITVDSDTKIIVPDVLYDEWIVATNWATYVANISKVSDI